MQQATLIYNPLAGPTNLAAAVNQVADSWRARGWSISVQPTQAAGHATELARGAVVSGHQLVFAAGGDGTLGEVANGLAGSETIMAPLPVGTANSFARELLMPLPNLLNPHKLQLASKALAAGKVQRMDLGYFRHNDGSGHYFLLWAGTGADGYLVDQLEPRPKWSKRLGRLGYSTQSLMAARNLPDMRATVEVDGRTITDQFVLVLVSNCRLYAGGEVRLNPGARLDDGDFDIWLFRGQGIRQVAHHMIQTKLERHHHDPLVTQLQGSRVVVRTDPVMPCQTDGDRAGSTPLECEIRPGALRLLVPETAPDDLFERPGQRLEDLG